MTGSAPANFSNKNVPSRAQPVDWSRRKLTWISARLVARRRCELGDANPVMVRSLLCSNGQVGPINSAECSVLYSLLIMYPSWGKLGTMIYSVFSIL
jgi:hypothetical protein